LEGTAITMTRLADTVDGVIAWTPPRHLAAEAAGLWAELERLVAAVAPWLLELPGWGRAAPPRSW
jgi:hypothetical protein